MTRAVDYDAARAARMLHALRGAPPEKRLDTLVAVIECWIRAHPSSANYDPALGEFFGRPR
jgi:hypothetical protein